MITHRHKQIKKQLPPTFHLHLHRPTPLKRSPTPYNQRQIMRPQLTLRIRRVHVRIPRTAQDYVAGDVGVEALLFQREAFEMLEGVFLGCAAI